MKNITFLIAALFLTLQLHAQPAANAGVQQGLNFQHDFDESLHLAKASGKKVLMIFSGSDWCKPCIQLRNTILTQSEFAQFSESNLVILELDFPYRKKNKLSKEQKAHNEALAEKYNAEGAFPRLILFDADQNKLGQVDYNTSMTTEQMVGQIEGLLKEEKLVERNGRE